MIRGFICALELLTRIPIPVQITYREDTLKKSVFFYPVVGLILGFLSSLPFRFLHQKSVGIASFLTVFLMICLTGGLHLDGLADTIDGFFSNRPKEKVLEIMKDSRIGAFGVIGLLIIVLGKFVIISNLNEKLPLYLMFSMSLSRLLVGFQMSFLKTARPDGMGDTMQQSKPAIYVLLASVIFLIIVCYSNSKLLWIVAADILIVGIVSKKSYKTIGGVTGDVFGASIEIIEVCSLCMCWLLEGCV